MGNACSAETTATPQQTSSHKYDENDVTSCDNEDGGSGTRCSAANTHNWQELDDMALDSCSGVSTAEPGAIVKYTRLQSKILKAKLSHGIDGNADFVIDDNETGGDVAEPISLLDRKSVDIDDLDYHISLRRSRDTITWWIQHSVSECVKASLEELEEAKNASASANSKPTKQIFRGDGDHDDDGDDCDDDCVTQNVDGGVDEENTTRKRVNRGALVDSPHQRFAHSIALRLYHYHQQQLSLKQPGKPHGAARGGGGGGFPSQETMQALLVQQNGDDFDNDDIDARTDEQMQDRKIGKEFCEWTGPSVDHILFPKGIRSFFLGAGDGHKGNKKHDDAQSSRSKQQTSNTMMMMMPPGAVGEEEPEVLSGYDPPSLGRNRRLLHHLEEERAGGAPELTTRSVRNWTVLSSATCKKFYNPALNDNFPGQVDPMVYREVMCSVGCSSSSSSTTKVNAGRHHRTSTSGVDFVPLHRRLDDPQGTARYFHSLSPMVRHVALRDILSEGSCSQQHPDDVITTTPTTNTVIPVGVADGNSNVSGSTSTTVSGLEGSGGEVFNAATNASPLSVFSGLLLLAPASQRSL